MVEDKYTYMEFSLYKLYLFFIYTKKYFFTYSFIF